MSKVFLPEIFSTIFLQYLSLIMRCFLLNVLIILKW
uniref:Uncharacterized protein n=1 Tax=Siphoviridae sp. ct16M3 TaxID=2825305 RepID=A0A8S5PRC0_9CAUD|nr:MAG TPA: hypothetical protein [Siphoviridae sp. ct16M3]